MRRVCVAMGVLAAVCAAPVMGQDAEEPAANADQVFTPSFRVFFDESLRSEPATGRVILYFAADGAPIGAMAPADGPFPHAPQPMYSIAVTDMQPGTNNAVIVDDSAEFYPVKLSNLDEGLYRVQAVLDLQRTHSNWKNESGNLVTSPPYWVYMPGEDGVVQDEEMKSRVSFPLQISLDRAMERDPLPNHPEMVQIEVRSDLLSNFHGHDVMLRGAAIRPLLHDPEKKYAAVYEIPSFGDDHYQVFEELKRLRRSPAYQTELRRRTWRIVLDPEGPNGHTLFADSANNGPVGQALIEEFIPACEEQLGLIAERDARLTVGHSSGAWSAIWLTVRYPEVFGACWASAPDPVDFRAFQNIDIYEMKNMYVLPGGELIPAMRSTPLMVWQEDWSEKVLGPDNTSGGQWDSWQAVFGPRNESGNPAAAWSVETGVIDHDITKQFRAYDISAMLRDQPKKYGPIFQNRVHIIAGDQDDYFLNGAVELLRDELVSLGYEPNIPGGGYIEIVPGGDHGSVGGWQWALRWGQEMAEFLDAKGIQIDGSN